MHWSTKLLHARTCHYWDGWPSLDHPSSCYLNQAPRPTQLPTLSGMENKYYWLTGDDTLQLGSKGRYCLYHLQVNVQVTDKTLCSLVKTCHTWAQLSRNRPHCLSEFLRQCEVSWMTGIHLICKKSASIGYRRVRFVHVGGVHEDATRKLLP